MARQLIFLVILGKELGITKQSQSSVFPQTETF